MSTQYQEICIELYSPDDIVEVQFNVELDISPSEYEGGYLFHGGSAEVVDYKVKPFWFNGKFYEKFDPILVKNIDFGNSFKDKKLISTCLADGATEENCTKLLDNYLQFVLDNYVELEIPSKYYPMTR